MKIDAMRRVMGKLLPRMAIVAAGLVVIFATILLAIIASTNGYFSAAYFFGCVGAFDYGAEADIYGD